MPELSVRICGLTVRLEAESASVIAAARRRYAAFLARGKPDTSIRLMLTGKKLRSYRDEPRAVWDGRAGRVERHDLELDLAPGLGLATVAANPSALDSLLRIVLSFLMVQRGGFLCHSAAVDGWLFPGVSGAGKSTLGRSAPKKRLLADELVGVVGDRLYGTPFRGDFLIGRTNVSRPLEAVVLLDRKGPRGVRSIPKSFALVRLLQCALYFGDDPRGSRAILAAARRCVLRAATFALGYDARTTPFSAVETMIRKALR
ncbi:MAG TPA: hypothetical protein VKW04_05270 [Planctomycetota bacterium]|nr:hypothetical protein [Planctomycetota bacterium]